ncbi:LuxR C-terminal-related transcriptional regulator [Miltoncostaea marina]|uniref:LuxR C-terminal-related transcriptional regulator n=1 Tax=Miltoncostaea marina TaxID=2843215 RepID=UPI001C3E0D7F|nr:response regulator transcription factor [Miltoncostaea marina]
MKVFVLDPHLIYRRGVTSCLGDADGITGVAEAGSVREAWQQEGLRDAAVVVVDHGVPGALEFIRQVREATGARVLVCSGRGDETEVVAAVTAGALGYICKDTLTPESLVAAVHAAATGSGVMAPELLGTLLRNISRAHEEVLAPRGLSLTRLNPREQQVMRLVADGHPIREVAEQLRYSERTIKNVIHDVVTKLNVRTRSQAVAHAVREGLI